MTNDELEAQSRAAIKAWCDDPSVQLEYKIPENDVWYVCNHYETFHLRAYHYRIAQPKKWYRVAEMKSGITVTADYFLPEKSVRGRPGFVKWLDERKYYD